MDGSPERLGGKATYQRARRPSPCRAAVLSLRWPGGASAEWRLGRQWSGEQAGDEVDRAGHDHHAEQIRQEGLGQHGAPDPPVAHRGIRHLVAHANREGDIGEVPVGRRLRPVRVAEGDARLPGTKGCKTFWVSSTRLCLRHVGDVTVVLSKRGRNLGPKQTKILVTNLAELTPSQVVCMYQKRWAIELLNWELKSGLGLGEHQVSGDTNRSEKSVGIAVLAYLLVLRVCHHEIVPGKPWSIFQLQHTLRLRIMTNQVEHKVKVKMAKTRKAA